MIFNAYLHHNGGNSFIIIIYKTALIKVTKNHRKKSISMCHFLEAALNLIPQRSMSVGTLHKAKWHLGQANKPFENEKKKLQQMNIKTISAGHWTIAQQI